MNWYQIVESPIGPLLLLADDTALTGIEFAPHHHHPAGRAGWKDGGPILAEAARQLEAYFSGERLEFDLPLDAAGTPFQQRVWKALREVPYGQTRSYGEVAERLGVPGASRAVGLANARNPWPVVVPCHRVIGAGGGLTGYGGGLDRKRWLLAHEQRFGPARPLAHQGVLLESA
jgi:methylated-DNA-[protein]-cysteine S-methyltransferase